MTKRTRKPPVGAQPGTLALAADTPPPVVRVLSYTEGSFENHGAAAVEEIERLKRSERKVWVNVQGLGDEPFLRRLASSIGPTESPSGMSVTSTSTSSPTVCSQSRKGTDAGRSAKQVQTRDNDLHQ